MGIIRDRTTYNVIDETELEVCVEVSMTYYDGDKRMIRCWWDKAFVSDVDIKNNAPARHLTFTCVYDIKEILKNTRICYENYSARDRPFREVGRVPCVR